jgi:hypothetical protein
VLVIFETRSLFMLRQAWATTLLFLLPQIARMTVYCHVQPLVQMGSHEPFAWTGLKLWPSWYLPPK